MDFALTPEQQEFRNTIVAFARETLNPGAAARDREQKFPRDLWQRCGELGLPGLAIGEVYGGVGLDAVSTALALEALGYGCEDGGFAFSLCAHLLACAIPLDRFGSDDQRRRFLPGMCDGTLIAVNGMTEPGSGSDAFTMQTRATVDGAGYRLNGTKTFASNGPVGDVALVFAMTDKAKGFHGGVTAFLVEADAKGYSASRSTEKMGLRTSPFGELVLDDVYVPCEQVVGGVGGGARVFLTAMDWERALLGATHVGTMQRLLETAVRYARTRVAGGQPIGKFQGVSHKIADMKVRLEAARLLVYRAAWQLDRSRTPALDASIAKLFVSEALVSSALDTVQVHGGYGYTTEYGIERVLRDAVASPLYSGTSEMQRNTIASWLGL
jgi:alkylation response protein AidB-like acyl-CoA dehydrogenase